MAEFPEVDVDVAVLGAGPVGLYGAYYAGFRGLSVAVIDGLDDIGGQVTSLYPEKDIHDVAGFRTIRGAELIQSLVEQAAQFEPVYLLGRSAFGYERTGDTHALTLADGTLVRCRAVLMCAGLGSMEPKALPAARGWSGVGVVYSVPELSILDQRDVLVVGGGDSAVDWANAAHGRASSVSIVHRRQHFRAHESSVQRMKSSGTRLLLDAEVAELHSDDDGALQAVSVSTAEGPSLRTQCDLLVASLGFTTKLGPIASWGLQFEGRHVKVGSDMQTSVPGVYAAGDVSEYDGKVRLISVGFGEAAIAVNHLAASLDPGTQIFPGHSTHHGN
jgi:thioredoxin reductase (NADPH)